MRILDRIPNERMSVRQQCPAKVIGSSNMRKAATMLNTLSSRATGWDSYIGDKSRCRPTVISIPRR